MRHFLAAASFFAGGFCLMCAFVSVNDGSSVWAFTNLALSLANVTIGAFHASRLKASA